MNLSNPDFNPAQFQRQESLSGLGRIKPELYKQRSVDAEDGRHSDSCGRLHFILKFDFDLEQLIVKIHKAQDLPAKDFSGTSDPYVKIYLLPDRKTKHQTKVHRKTLNPVFDEVFLFPVAYAELSSRKLHFSVYDFDRFSRHDVIGQVVVDNFLDLADFPRETKLCRDIQYVTSVRYHLSSISLYFVASSSKCVLEIIFTYIFCSIFPLGYIHWSTKAKVSEIAQIPCPFFSLAKICLIKKSKNPCKGLLQQQREGDISVDLYLISLPSGTHLWFQETET